MVMDDQIGFSQLSIARALDCLEQAAGSREGRDLLRDPLILDDLHRQKKRMVYLLDVLNEMEVEAA